MPRADGRANDRIRPVTITRNYLKYAEGSCLIELGETKVICSASVDDRVPSFLRGAGSGWITAEYGMLPRSCHTRSLREAATGKMGGRTHEIQRLIGRSLRGVVELNFLGERTIILDCDVIQADGGTRTAAITGSYVALVDALKVLQEQNIFRKLPIMDSVAAVSVGIVQGEELLDLTYDEDSQALVDMNVVMTGKGKLVEVQGTAEGMPFDRQQMNSLLDLAEKGIKELLEAQKQALEEES